MINGMNIFYSSKSGSGLEVESTNQGKGLNPILTKGTGCKKVKKLYKIQKASGLKILN